MVVRRAAALPPATRTRSSMAAIPRKPSLHPLKDQSLRETRYGSSALRADQDGEGELVGEILGIASAEALGLDSWIMVGADGLGSKEGVRVFSLIMLAQFVWRVSSAGDSRRRPQVV
jgi:hypothetical protein